MPARVHEIIHRREAGATDHPVVRRGGGMGIQNVILREPRHRRGAVESPVASIVGPGLRIGFSSRWFGDDVLWHGTGYHEAEASTHPDALADGAEPPEDLFPVVWDRELGSVAERTGTFTPHITLEPRKGGTAVG